MKVFEGQTEAPNVKMKIKFRDTETKSVGLVKTRVVTKS